MGRTFIHLSVIRNEAVCALLGVGPGLTLIFRLRIVLTEFNQNPRILRFKLTVAEYY
jgi:hypothetical protein